MRHLAGSCTKSGEAAKILEDNAVTLLITTQVLEEGSGIDLINLAKQARPGIKTLLFLQHNNLSLFEAAISSHSDGIVLETEMGTGHVIEAIKRVASGGFYLEPLVGEALSGICHGPNPKLNDKELKVMQKVVYGLTDREIGNALHCASDTVKYHLKQTYNKLGVHSRTRGAICVVLMGLVDPPIPLTPEQ